MSFRRDHDAELEWRRWVRAHEAELVAIGIPREVWADRLTWWRFVDHGYHPPASNRRDVRFSADDLPESQQHRLYVFLDTILPAARYGHSLWAVLHSRFGAASQTEHLPR
ncbi:hypothetical protein [Urbifossiella limnaea]|uniref:Uncharacterized protein n=1 Tax=Urbifossiella limnaea TaxID=2528023 RepID=A0A517XMB6_9BACT|nr:hypothetical protein [Urbifossiella limnaea]QDU18650.1 hypothetical protein ETAA1_05430 [Urbifossiella limnaea]